MKVLIAAKMPTEAAAMTRTPPTITRSELEKCVCSTQTSLFFVVTSLFRFVCRSPQSSSQDALLISLCFAHSCPNQRPEPQIRDSTASLGDGGLTCVQQDVSRGLETSLSGGNITCDREIASKSICGNYSLRASWNSSTTSKSP